MIQKCPSCKGSKKVMRLGMVMQDCEQCSGAGQVKTDSVKRGFDIEPPQSTQGISQPIIEEAVDNTPSKDQSREDLKPMKHKGSNSNGKDRKGR